MITYKCPSCETSFQDLKAILKCPHCGNFESSGRYDIFSVYRELHINVISQLDTLEKNLLEKIPTMNTYQVSNIKHKINHLIEMGLKDHFGVKR